MSLRPTPGPYLADGAHRGWSRAQPGADGPCEASSLQSRPRPSPLTVLPWILTLLHSITSESLQTGPPLAWTRLSPPAPRSGSRVRPPAALRPRGQPSPPLRWSAGEHGLTPGSRPPSPGRPPRHPRARLSTLSSVPPRNPTPTPFHALCPDTSDFGQFLSHTLFPLPGTFFPQPPFSV